MPFSITDHVQHVTPNAPEMVVVGIRSRYDTTSQPSGWKYLCRWFDVHAVLQEGRFSDAELRLVKSFVPDPTSPYPEDLPPLELP